MNPVSTSASSQGTYMSVYIGLVSVYNCSPMELFSLLQGQGSAEGVPQYGPGPGSWGTYDMQRAHGHR